MLSDPLKRPPGTLPSVPPPGRIAVLVRSAPGRPDFRAGLRAAIATMLPLAAAQAFHLGPAAGSWMSLAGFSVAIADRGGIYRLRAVTMTTLTTAIAVSAVVAGVAGRNPWLAAAIAFVWVGVASLARVYGNSGLSIGSSMAVTFVISLASPATSAASALSRGGYILLGGVWAMLLSLFVWPLRPYRPLRLTVAQCFRHLASYADELRRTLSESVDEMEIVRLESERANIRATIEQAREQLAASRRGRAGESQRGERLLVLLQGADQLFGTLIALGDVSDPGEGDLSDRRSDLRALVANELAGFVDAARAVATIVETEDVTPETPSLRWITEPTGAAPDDAASDPAAEHVHRLVARLEQYTVVAAQTAAAIESGPQATAASDVGGIDVGDVEEGPSMMETLRESLSRDSLALPHALRVAIVTAIAVIITHALGLSRGYWVTLTVIIILQPFAGSTMLRALQRVGGTVAGALLTAGLVSLVHDPRWILALVFVLAVVCVSFLRVNYLIYSIFLTPTFVLLAEVSAGDWHLAGLRVVNTLLGGALGLLGAWLLWPSPERNRFPELTAAAMLACRDHLRLVADYWQATDEQSALALGESRRRVGLAVINASGSFDRLLLESAQSAAKLEPFMTTLTYIRRLIASATALAAARYAPNAGSFEPLVKRFAERAATVLDDLAVAFVERRLPAPLPPAASSDRIDVRLAPVLRAPLDRVARQLEVLHGAVGRAATSDVSKANAA